MDDEQSFSYSIASWLIWSLTLREGVESASLQFQRRNPNHPATRSLENQITSNLGSNMFFSMVSMVFLWFFDGVSMVLPCFSIVFLVG